MLEDSCPAIELDPGCTCAFLFLCELLAVGVEIAVYGIYRVVKSVAYIAPREYAARSCNYLINAEYPCFQVGILVIIEVEMGVEDIWIHSISQFPIIRHAVFVLIDRRSPGT